MCRRRTRRRRTRRSSMICSLRHQQPKVPWYDLLPFCCVYASYVVYHLTVALRLLITPSKVCITWALQTKIFKIQLILFLCHEFRNLCDLSGNSLIGSGFRTLIGVGVIIIDNVYRGHPSKPIFCIKLQIHTCTVIYSFFLSFKRKLNPTQCMWSSHRWWYDPIFLG